MPAPPEAITGTLTAAATASSRAQIVAVARAVAVHAGQQDLAGATLSRRHRPGNHVESGRPPAAVGEDPPAAAVRGRPRRASIATTMHWRPNASAPAVINSGCWIAAVLIETLSAPAVSSSRMSATDADAAADRQRDEDLVGGPRDHVDHRPPAVGAGGDVEEDQLVGALGVVEGGQLDRVAGVSQVDELDALDDPAVGDVEAGNDAAKGGRDSCALPPRLLDSCGGDRRCQIDSAVVERAADDYPGGTGRRDSRHIRRRTDASGGDHIGIQSKRRARATPPDSVRPACRRGECR